MKNVQDDFHFSMFSVSIQHNDQNLRRGKSSDDTCRCGKLLKLLCFTFTCCPERHCHASLGHLYNCDTLKNLLLNDRDRPTFITIAL